MHPGEVLMEDFTEGSGITQHKLAVAIGVPPKRINEIVHGKRGVAADTAMRDTTNVSEGIDIAPRMIRSSTSLCRTVFSTPVLAVKNSVGATIALFPSGRKEFTTC